MKRPILPEIAALIAASLAGSRIGYTTVIGNAAGTTFTDYGLIGAGANSFISMSVVIAPDSILTIDRAEIAAFDNATGEITLDTAYKGGQIPAGTQYALLTSSADLGPLTDLINAIKVVTDALLVLSETGGTLTTDGNVQNLYINDAPAGVFDPRAIKLDCSAHTAGETIELNLYYRIIDGGGMILQDTQTYVGVISPPLLKIGLDENRFGVQLTIQKTAGANRAYPWGLILGI